MLKVKFTLYWIAFRADTKSYPVKYDHKFDVFRDH